MKINYLSNINPHNKINFKNDLDDELAQLRQLKSEMAKNQQKRNKEIKQSRMERRGYLFYTKTPYNEIENSIKTNIELTKYLNKLKYIEEILEKSDPRYLGDDSKILIDYLRNLKRINLDEGFNKVVGYDDIKIDLERNFVFNIMAKDRTSQKVDVPKAVLLYGPTGCGKTNFARALAQQTLSNCVELNLDNYNEQDIMQELQDIAYKARDNYIDNNSQRTIIIINEADLIAHKNSPIIEKLKFFISCCKEFRCTVFLTTNYPDDIDDGILNKYITPIKIAIDAPDSSTVRKLIEKYLSQTCSKEEIDKFADYILKGKNESQYSIADIINIIDIANYDYNSPQAQQYIDTIEKYEIMPSLTPDVMANFERQKQMFKKD